MKTWGVRGFVLLLWLIATAWLIRYEAFPERFTHTLAGYRHLLDDDTLVSDSWMRILLKGRPIGYTHTSIDTDDSNPLRRSTLLSEMEIRISLMGQDQRISVESSATLDLLHHLQGFEFLFSSEGYSLKVTGARIRDERFRVRLATGTSVQNLRIDIPDDVVIYSPAMDATLRRLKPGQEVRFKTFDPATLTPADLLVRALREETIALAGVSNRTMVISTEYQGVSVLSWMDLEGRLLRQETPFGWQLEACTPREALATLDTHGPSDDLLSAMAVPLDGALPAAAASGPLRLQLSGVLFQPHELENPRQRVESQDGPDTVLVVSAGRWPDPPLANTPPPDLREWLQATPSLQADHPDIKARADAITRDGATPTEKAQAIFRWVHTHLDKEMTVSLPSALDVLRSGQGDCNEHTYLFVALARAARLPAKIVVGLAYQNGAFYYHAWPAVYVGAWVEMDPTWGQETVDATHLALVEGELRQQMQLARIIGQLRIRALEIPRHD